MQEQTTLPNKTESQQEMMKTIKKKKENQIKAKRLLPTLIKKKNF